jgi:hypothetical protein
MVKNARGDSEERENVYQEDFVIDVSATSYGPRKGSNGNLAESPREGVDCWRASPAKRARKWTKGLSSLELRDMVLNLAMMKCIALCKLPFDET